LFARQHDFPHLHRPVRKVLSYRRSHEWIYSIR
jgi:hypothetical protein